MGKRPLGPIEGRGIRLRLLGPGDLDRTLEWRNRDENRRWFVHSDPINMETHLRWFEAYQTRDDDFVFVVETSTDRPVPIGQVSLYRIDWELRAGEFGRLLIGDPHARGRGLGLEATRTLVDFGFGTMGLSRIHLEVFVDNVAAIKIYRKCGFQEAGPYSPTKLLNMELRRRDWTALRTASESGEGTDSCGSPEAESAT